jgi:hypothetical protein
MKIRFRVWDKIDKVMILPESEEVRKSGEWPSLLAMGLHGLPIGIDKDSVKEREIIGWNVDHNRFPMRYTTLKDSDDTEVVAGDLRVIFGKLYKVVDEGFRFSFERNLVYFGDNDRITLDEDTAYQSRLVGNIYQDDKLMVNKEQHENS